MGLCFEYHMTFCLVLLTDFQFLLSDCVSKDVCLISNNNGVAGVEDNNLTLREESLQKSCLFLSS